MVAWAVLDFLLLVAGVVALALSLTWRAPNLLMNMVLSSADLTGVCCGLLPFWSISHYHRLVGTILGIALLITFAVSICAIVQRSHVTIGLVILNYTLLIDAIGIIIIGTFVWFYTLQERANFHVLWADASRETRITLQDQVCSQTLANPFTTSSIC
jgi:hypothetical protein